MQHRALLAAAVLAVALLATVIVPAIAQQTATPSAGVENLTGPQLNDIFVSCEIRDWRQLEDSAVFDPAYTLPADYDYDDPDNVPILVYTAQAGSGTRTTWDGFVGGNSETCIPQEERVNRVIFENDARPIPADEAGSAIFFFSTARYNSVPAVGSAIGAELLAVDGAEPTNANIGNGSFPYGRFVYNVYDVNNVTPGTLSYIEESNGWICKPPQAHAPGVGEAIDAAISASGFAPLAVGPTTGGVEGQSKCRVTDSAGSPGGEGPAPANDGQADILLGSGSDTTYPVMQSLDLIYNLSAGCRTEVVSGSGQTQPLDGSCVNPAPGEQRVTTENSDHDTVGSYFPVGSSNGIAQLTSARQPSVDYARSSRTPGSNDAPGLRFVAFAREGIAPVTFPAGTTDPGPNPTTSASPTARPTSTPTANPTPTSTATTAPGDGTVARFQGTGRIQTAVAISRGAFPDGAPLAYVARADQFPDALTGGPPAAEDGAPILLTAVDSLPQETAAELERLGVENIVVLGGEAAVNAAVFDQLNAIAPATRAAGANRFGTAAAISSANYEPGVSVAYVAFGGNFPDALAGGPLAANDDAPILLTAENVPAETAAELQRLQPLSIVVLGGTAAVPQSVQDDLQQFTAGQVTRLGGANRFATAAQILQQFAEPVDTVYVATGANFPDALAGVPAAVADGGPIALVAENVPAEIAPELERLDPADIRILGGTAVVSQDVEDALAGFLR